MAQLNGICKEQVELLSVFVKRIFSNKSLAWGVDVNSSHGKYQVKLGRSELTVRINILIIIMDALTHPTMPAPSFNRASQTIY